MMFPIDDFANYEESPAADAPRRSAAPRWFGELDDLDFEIEFFDAILRRRPDYVDVLRVLGELLSRKGLFLRTLDIDSRLVALQPDDGIARYNLACSLTRHGEYDRAISELARALETGYDDIEHLEADPDLQPLRELPAYLELLRRYDTQTS